MVKILPYNPKVNVLWATPEPANVVSIAAQNTMKGIFGQSDTQVKDVAPFLYKANHGSPLEHAVICFDITQISRACLDQLVRHRIGSFTSSSQHYQDHRDYVMRMSMSMCNPDATWTDNVNTSMSEYAWAIDNGVPKEEARMLLPMATEVRVIWTVNARALANFINLRTCYRNVIEMVLLAHEVRYRAILWFNSLFDYVHRDCAFGGCRQGKMMCRFSEREKLLWEYKNYASEHQDD